MSESLIMIEMLDEEERLMFFLLIYDTLADIIKDVNPSDGNCGSNAIQIDLSDGVSSWFILNGSMVKMVRSLFSKDDNGENFYCLSEENALPRYIPLADPEFQEKVAAIVKDYIN